jgi:sugar phosphate isomerase/epimerase
VGEHIRVVHVKDCRITGQLPVSILEIPLGEGEYDLASLIACARDHRDADLPLLLEHLPDLAAFDKAAAHFRRVAEAQGVRV